MNLLREHQIGIRIDDKGCWRDKRLVERLWNAIKYEHVYLHAYDTVSEARAKIASYPDFCKRRRPHSSVERRTPDDVYINRPALKLAA
jgi:putative transposase